MTSVTEGMACLACATGDGKRERGSLFLIRKEGEGIVTKNENYMDLGVASQVCSLCA